MNGQFEEPLVDATAGALQIGVKPDTLRKWARQGYVPAFKVRGALRFRPSDLRALVIRRLTQNGKRDDRSDGAR